MKNFPLTCGLFLSFAGLLSQTPLAHADAATDQFKQSLQVEVNGSSYTFPAQEKDWVKTATGAQFQSDFLNYVTQTLHELTDTSSSDISLQAADPTQVSKVTLQGTLKDGSRLVDYLTKVEIQVSVAQNQSTATAITEKTLGKILNQTGIDLGPLELLGEGKSTFWGSSPEREFNIRKALTEKFNGILIPAGSEFSYVEWLGPIEYGGWKRAYAIFNGTQVEPAPAGGVCQVSTTVYRAALDAALDITEQRSHSLYVVYYNDYGDGLDATVFPDEQDLKFINNTSGPILMVAQEEGYYEATVRLYGTSDGRSTTLIGPYTASNETDETLANVGDLGIGDMVWKYLITWGDGTQETRWLHSSYLSKAKQHNEAATALNTDHL